MLATEFKQSSKVFLVRARSNLRERLQDLPQPCHSPCLVPQGEPTEDSPALEEGKVNAELATQKHLKFIGSEVSQLDIRKEGAEALLEAAQLLTYRP